MTLGDDETTAPASNGAATNGTPAHEPRPTGGAAPRLSEAAKEVITAHADAPTREIQAALRAEGIELDIMQIRRARWYHASGGKEKEAGRYRGTKAPPAKTPPAITPPAITPATYRKATGRKPSIHQGAYELIQANCERPSHELDRMLRASGYILDAHTLRRQGQRARDRRRAANGELAPQPGTLGAAVVELLAEGVSDVSVMMTALKKRGHRKVNIETVYRFRSRFRAYAASLTGGTAPPPRPRAALAPAAPPPAPAVMVDSRDSDRNQLRVLVLRVGLNVAREVIQEMEHILARTEAKL